MSTSPVLLLVTLLLSACYGKEQIDSMKAKKVEAPQKALLCPDPTDIEPCVCTNDTYLIMHCGNVQDEQQLWHVFSAYFPMTAFYRLNIRDNEGLKVLENGVFHNISFQVIDIGSSALQVVEDQALDSSFSTLTDISIQGCHLSTFPFDRLPEMTSLKYLSFYYNYIPSIPPLSSTTLAYLAMDKNPIASLPVDAFKDLPAIRLISFGECQLTEITPGTFRDLPVLESVSLDNNNLTYIQSFTFQNSYFPLITVVIRLDHNNIDFIEVDAFEGVGELGQDFMLSMEYNALTRLPETEWRPVLEKATYIYFAGNPFICGCDVAWLARNPQLLTKVAGGVCPDGKPLTELDPADFSTCD